MEPETTKHRAARLTAFLRRHGPFLLLFVGFYALALHVLLGFSDWDLSNDEFIMFEHARRFLRTGRFIPGKSIDTHVFIGLPRGVVFWVMTVASMRFLGVSETAARLPSLVAGALSMIALYVLLLRVSGRREVGLLGALVLILTPLFVRWHFCCRFYTLILLFHVLATLFLYEGLEGAHKEEGFPEVAPEEGEGVRAALARYFARERLRPGYLVLFLVLYAFNLNQHIVLAMLPVGLGGYGMVMLVLNVAERRAPGEGRHGLGGRLFHKYVVLAALAPFAVASIYVSLKWSDSDFIQALPVLKSVPQMLQTNFDVTFGQGYPRLIRSFFPAPVTVPLLAIAGVGVVGFRRFSRKGYGNMGLFLIVPLVICLLLGVYGWKRPAPRYAIFLLALHVPLMAMGIYTAGFWLLRLWARVRRREPRAQAGPAAALCGGAALLLLYLPVFATDFYPQRAFYKPFDNVEFERGYDILFGSLRRGDYVLLLHRREYYAERMMRRHGVSQADLEWDYFAGEKQFTVEDLRAVMEQHPRGWIMWARRKGWHLRVDLMEFCRRNLTAHHTERGTVRIYSWGADGRDGEAPPGGPEEGRAR